MLVSINSLSCFITCKSVSLSVSCLAMDRHWRNNNNPFFLLPAAKTAWCSCKPSWKKLTWGGHLKKIKGFKSFREMTILHQQHFGWIHIWINVCKGSILSCTVLCSYLKKDILPIAKVFSERSLLHPLWTLLFYHSPEHRNAFLLITTLFQSDKTWLKSFILAQASSLPTYMIYMETPRRVKHTSGATLSEATSRCWGIGGADRTFSNGDAGQQWLWQEKERDGTFFQPPNQGSLPGQACQAPSTCTIHSYYLVVLK